MDRGSYQQEIRQQYAFPEPIYKRRLEDAYQRTQIDGRDTNSSIYQRTDDMDGGTYQ